MVKGLVYGLISSVVIAFCLFCPWVHAENWVRPAEVEQGMVRGFQLKASCEQGGRECQELGAIDLKDAVVEDIDGKKVVSEDKNKAKASKDKRDAANNNGQARKAARVRLKELNDLSRALSSDEKEEALDLLILLQAKRP